MGLKAVVYWLSSVGWCCLAVFLYSCYKLKRRLDYYKERGFACLPLKESLRQSYRLITFTEPAHEINDRNYKYFGGQKLGAVSMLGGHQMLVIDPDLIHKILIKDFSHFHDHGFPVDTEVNPLEGHLFHMNGSRWRALRNKLTPTFTSGKLKRMMPQIAASAHQLIEILREIRPGEDFYMRDLLSRFAIDVIGSCAFGVETCSLKNPECEFKRVASKIFNPGRLQMLKMWVQALAPGLSKRLKLKTVDEEVTRFVFGLTRQVFEQRTNTGIRRNDFVDLLLQLKVKGSVDCDPKELAEDHEDTAFSPGFEEEESEKLVLTDALLTAQAFVFLVGGWESVAVIIVFALYCLGKHPDAQQRACHEVKRIKRKHGGHFTYEALKEMVYLDACISESMRLYPPNVSLFHSCTKTYRMDDGRVIDKGTSILIPIYSLHRDPAYFQDPEEYRPERFMPEQTIPSNVYMPFGDGPRICIARRFALLEVKLLMAMLLDSFKFRNSPKMKEPINIDPDFFLIDIKGGLWMRLEPVKY